MTEIVHVRHLENEPVHLSEIVPEHLFASELEPHLQQIDIFPLLVIDLLGEDQGRLVRFDVEKEHLFEIREKGRLGELETEHVHRRAEFLPGEILPDEVLHAEVPHIEVLHVEARLEELPHDEIPRGEMSIGGTGQARHVENSLEIPGA